MQIEVFKNTEFSVRTIKENNQIYFIANDVAKALGYSDPSKTVSTKVKNEYKGVTKTVTPSGNQQVTTINEAGVYQLIFSSKLESAERFRSWVFEEVLPSIRKTGSYSVDPNIQAINQRMNNMATYLTSTLNLINMRIEHLDALVTPVNSEVSLADELSILFSLAGIKIEREYLLKTGRVPDFVRITPRRAEFYELKRVDYKLTAEDVYKHCLPLKYRNLTNNPTAQMRGYVDTLSNMTQTTKVFYFITDEITEDAEEALEYVNHLYRDVIVRHKTINQLIFELWDKIAKKDNLERLKSEGKLNRLPRTKKLFNL